MTRVFADKVRRVLSRRVASWVGGLVHNLDETLEGMALRPYELHLELTNLCNAACVFCPYVQQERPHQRMSDAVFERAVEGFVGLGGGSVSLTPIVGEPLVHPRFLDHVRRLRREPAIDRIFAITNGILLDKVGIDEFLESGLTAVAISTAGFEAESYARIYRSKSYDRMRRNVTALVQRNRALGSPVEITIALRSDRPLREVMADPDFQPILAEDPMIDFTWSFTSAGGRIQRSELPEGMRLRTVKAKREACVQTFNGPIVLPAGEVLGCSCVAAMDAIDDLQIGHLDEEGLDTIWKGERLRKLRASFAEGSLNPTCLACDMYRDLELYRTHEGRERARLNRSRADGRIERRQAAETPFAGG